MPSPKLPDLKPRRSPFSLRRNDVPAAVEYIKAAVARGDLNDDDLHGAYT
jgi:hypothetical protein